MRMTSNDHEDSGNSNATPSAVLPVAPSESPSSESFTSIPKFRIKEALTVIPHDVLEVAYSVGGDNCRGNDLTPVEPGRNLFDRLPDELISRIFTIGIEYHATRDLDGLEDSTIPFFRRCPYSFIRHVSAICRRFYSITRLSSNAHFYCISAAIAQETFSSVHLDVAPFHHALKVSNGCDIQLRIKLLRNYGMTTPGCGSSTIDSPFMHSSLSCRISSNS